MCVSTCQRTSFNWQVYTSFIIAGGKEERMSADVYRFASRILKELCLKKLFLEKEMKSFAEK